MSTGLALCPNRLNARQTGCSNLWHSIARQAPICPSGAVVAVGCGHGARGSRRASEGLWEEGSQLQVSMDWVTANELCFMVAKPGELHAGAWALSFQGAKQRDESWTGSVRPQGFTAVLPRL